MHVSACMALYRWVRACVCVYVRERETQVSLWQQLPSSSAHCHHQRNDQDGVGPIFSVSMWIHFERASASASASHATIAKNESDEEKLVAISHQKKVCRRQAGNAVCRNGEYLCRKQMREDYVRIKLMCYLIIHLHVSDMNSMAQK